MVARLGLVGRARRSLVFGSPLHRGVHKMLSGLAGQPLARDLSEIVDASRARLAVFQHGQHILETAGSHHANPLHQPIMRSLRCVHASPLRCIASS